MDSFGNAAEAAPSSPCGNPHSTLFSHTFLKKSSAGRTKGPEPERRERRALLCPPFGRFRTPNRRADHFCQPKTGYPHNSQLHNSQPVENGNPGRAWKICREPKSYTGVIHKKSGVIPKKGGGGFDPLDAVVFDFTRISIEFYLSDLEKSRYNKSQNRGGPGRWDRKGAPPRELERRKPV